MGLINFDKRTKFGRENAETLAILKFFYWIAKVLFWPVKFIIKLCINLVKLIWRKRRFILHGCTFGVFIWVPKLFRKLKERTKNQISDGNIKTRSER